MIEPNVESARMRRSADDVPAFSSNNCLLRVNEAIEEAIGDYVGDGANAPDLLFDIPKDGQVDKATVSVFLYDIHEDLQLRHGENRIFDRSNGESAPCVHSRFCYLITCWSAEHGGPPSSAAVSDIMTLANRVFNALINHRTLPGLPQAYCRVLPPTEQLNSLGTFWQALGNRPRLCMTYMVSVPVPLSPPPAFGPRVDRVRVQLDAEANGQVCTAITRALRQRLLRAANEIGARDRLKSRWSEERALIERLTMRCEQVARSDGAYRFRVHVVGDLLESGRGALHHLAKRPEEWLDTALEGIGGTTAVFLIDIVYRDAADARDAVDDDATS